MIVGGIVFVLYQRFDDVDWYVEVLCGWNQCYDQIGFGVYCSVVKYVVFDGVQLFQEMVNVCIIQCGCLLYGYMVFGMLFIGLGVFVFGGVCVECGMIVMVCGGILFEFYLLDEMLLIGVVVYFELMQQIEDVVDVWLDVCMLWYGVVEVLVVVCECVSM